MTSERFGSLADAPATLLIANARVVDPSDGTDAVRDVAIVNGLVSGRAPEATETIDASGMVLAPGFCDLHVHLREPGGTDAETAASGARAAARGGFTTVCAMPNTEPPLDSAELVAAATRRDVAARVRVLGAVTLGREGTTVAPLEEMAAAGAIGFSDDGSSVADVAVARAALQRIAMLGLPLVEHAEDASIAAGGVMREGWTATRLGLRSWSPRAETAVVARDLALAAESGARLHLTHVSTAVAADVIAAARMEGAAVTCDVTPHHVAMTDEWVAGSRRFAWDEPDPVDWQAYDGSCRVNPPLTSRSDALALLDLVAIGAIDAIATDHAPHPTDRKLVPFDEAAPGLVGLETALSIGLAAVEAGRLALPELLAALSTRPAAIIGEARGLRRGRPAELVLFDPAARWTVTAASMASRSANTPLVGMELPGLVRLTVADGRATYRSS